MKVCVVGTGYVGLVTGVCLAEMGNQVWCVDQNENIIDSLKKGISPIYEPGLEDLLERNLREKRLHFATVLRKVLPMVEFCFIAVGTPAQDDGTADLQHVHNVANEIGKAMMNRLIVVNKSTVPAGTAEIVSEIIANELKKRNLGELLFSVVSNPEFLKEGAAIKDFMGPDRIVIGVADEWAKERMQELYAPFLLRRNRMIFMDIRSAELTKYAANAMLATRISFMNEMARLCDEIGADIARIREGLASDPRIGEFFLYAGMGFGGSCFPKDLQQLVATGQKYGVEMNVVAAAEKANRIQKHYLFQLITREFGSELQGIKIAIWGLAFKPQTDDVRESPAIQLIEELYRAGASLAVYDPEAMATAREVLEKKNIVVVYAEDMMDAVLAADALILATEWRQFRQPDFFELGEIMNRKIIFDGRNQYSPTNVREMGFVYYGIGRGMKKLDP